MARHADTPKNLMIKRQLGIHKKQAAAAKAAKLAALTPQQRTRRDAGIAKRAVTRLEKQRAEEGEQRQRREEYKAEMAISKARMESDEKARQAQAAAELAHTPKENSDSPASIIHGPTKRSAAKKQRPKRPESLVDLAELRKDAYMPREMPNVIDLGMMAETAVLCADFEGGIGVWGEGGGDWANPGGWTALIEELNRQFLSKCTPSWCGELVNGEYNAVFKPDSTVREWLCLPNLGDGVAYDDVVIRLTRPDGGSTSKDDDFYRYKRLRNLTRELYYTMHGAVNGYGPRVYAAVLFPAVVQQSKHGPQQLYGTMYIMHRAGTDLSTVIEDRTDDLFHLRVNPPVHAEQMRKAGRTLAAVVFPVVFRQSKLGCLNFDTKPANLVFAEGAAPYSIDFDAAMFSIMPSMFADRWEGHLLMNLLLISSHVRCFHHPSIVEGWVECVRPLMLELLVHSRGAEWLHTAKAADRGFREIHRDTPGAATERLEMMVSAYFINPTSTRGRTAPFRADTRPCATPLVHQLARYCLHGTVRLADQALDSALGAWGC